MNNQLTEQQTKRIEQEAMKAYPPLVETKNVGLVFIDIDQNRYFRESFISGATAEALRSKELVAALENIEKCCDGQNPAHETIWRITYEVLKNYQQ